jgi:hypothetical protein
VLPAAFYLIQLGTFYNLKKLLGTKLYPKNNSHWWQHLVDGSVQPRNVDMNGDDFTSVLYFVEIWLGFKTKLKLLSPSLTFNEYIILQSNDHIEILKHLQDMRKENDIIWIANICEISFRSYASLCKQRLSANYDVRSPLFEDPLHDKERPMFWQPLYLNISSHSLLPLSRAYHNAVRPWPSSNVTSAKYWETDYIRIYENEKIPADLGRSLESYTKCHACINRGPHDKFPAPPMHYKWLVWAWS